MSRISVKIDHIVQRGLDPADRQPLLAGLKSELARLLADPSSGLKSARSRRTPVLRAGRISVEPDGGGVRKLGGGIARAIGNQVKR